MPPWKRPAPALVQLGSGPSVAARLPCLSSFAGLTSAKPSTALKRPLGKAATNLQRKAQKSLQPHSTSSVSWPPDCKSVCFSAKGTKHSPVPGRTQKQRCSQRGKCLQGFSTATQSISPARSQIREGNVFRFTSSVQQKPPQQQSENKC